ncbi:hypothetical protein F5887DRAFT_919943 [Amanita rubescens]|nr:hypothetical protein F5887DRAFT_919943 [Amanita rubescens]
MSTTELPPGIYHIVVAGLGVVEPARLTREGKNGVTVLPPSAQRNPEQEWEIVRGRGGNLIIARPSKIIPTSYLTYKGAPAQPKEHDIVEAHRLAESPLNEWHAGIAPGFRHFLRVAGSNLGIRFAPATIYPPILELGFENQLEWQFERVYLDE